MIKQVASPTAPEKHAVRRVTVMEVWATLLDTSARLFFPSVGGTVLGLWLDIRMSTKPWFTIGGVVLGTAVAFGLVYLQIKKINKDSTR